jgi:hypothetical protein
MRGRGERVRVALLVAIAREHGMSQQRVAERLGIESREVAAAAEKVRAVGWDDPKLRRGCGASPLCASCTGGTARWRSLLGEIAVSKRDGLPFRGRPRHLVPPPDHTLTVARAPSRASGRAE